MKQKSPSNFKLWLNKYKISDSLWITPDQAVKEFSDGRVISRFSEYWAEKLYGFKKCENSNESFYDGTLEHPLTGTLKVGVRSLTKTGIKFQQSKYIGSGRNCNIENLNESIKGIDYEIVVDIMCSPIIYLIPVSREVLMNLVTIGILTPNGLSRSNFYKSIFDIDNLKNIEEKISFNTIDLYNEKP